MPSDNDIARSAHHPHPAPLLPWAIGLVLGIVLDCMVPIQPTLAVVVLVAGALLWLRRGPAYTRTVGAAVLVAAGTGALLHDRAIRTVAPDNIVNYCAPRARIARVRGVVATRPVHYRRGYEPFSPWLFQQDRTAFILDVDGVETTQGWAPASGQVRVTIKQPALAVRAADRVAVFGWLYRPGPPRNPGQFDWSRYNARRGIRAGITCDGPRNVRIETDAPPAAQRWLTGMRRVVRRMLLDDRTEFADPGVSLLDAMVLGRRRGMDRGIERAFLDTGCAHFLAVSGFHVGVLAVTVWFLLRWFSVSNRVAAMATVGVVVAYALVADPRPPIIRAAIMAAAMGLAVILNRPFSPVNSLCLAAIVILMLDPASLFDAGFQLSFVAVAAILAVGPSVIELLHRFGGLSVRLATRRRPLPAAMQTVATRLTPPPSRVRRIGRHGVEALGIAVTAWLSALPIVALHFGQVAPAGWFCSLAALPFVIAVVVLGFAKLLVALVVPIAAPGIDLLLDSAVHLLMTVMNLLRDTVGGRVVISPPPWWVILAYYVGLAGLVLIARHRGAWRGALCLMATPILAIAVWRLAPAGDHGLLVTQFAVGRGTTTVIELPGGGVWIYDIGASGALDPGEAMVTPYLLSRRVRRIDGVILSHGNLDHFGGLCSVLDNFACGGVYMTPGFISRAGENSPAGTLLRELRQRGTTIIPVDSTSTVAPDPGVRAEILWPTPGQAAQPAENDQSIVWALTYRNFRILLTGDIGEVPQDYLMDHADLECDVLVLPHHGAVERNTAAFIEATDSRYLIRSSNVPGDGSPKLMRIIGDRRLFDTADCGAVQIRVSERGLRVTATRQ